MIVTINGWSIYCKNYVSFRWINSIWCQLESAELQSLFFPIIATIISFELKGREGTEKVKIYDDNHQTLLDSVTLTKDWKFFTYPLAERDRINYDARGESGNAGDIFLQDAVYFAIEHSNQWNKWQCGTSNENQRCSYVREGNFYWGGDYLVHLKKDKYWL